VIMTGSAIPPHPIGSGTYTADFGALGVVRVTIQGDE
jgi:hypothetical protein